MDENGLQNAEGNRSAEEASQFLDAEPHAVPLSVRVRVSSEASLSDVLVQSEATAMPHLPMSGACPAKEAAERDEWQGYPHELIRATKPNLEGVPAVLRTAR